MSDTLTVSENAAGQRLDLFCAANLPGHSRATLQRAIKDGQITVNNKVVKPRYLVHEDDIVVVPPLLDKEREGVRSTPGKPVSLPIIYQDEHVAVINKPAGVVVDGPTMAPRLVVHRLDKDTTGVLVLAKTPEAHAKLKQQFKQRHVKKEYLALVFGVPNAQDGRITKPIMRSKRNPMRRAIAPPKPLPRGRRQPTLRGAITEWQIEKKFDKHTLLRVFPYTGRTHQIRVHLHHLGLPIVGDQLYVFKRQRLPAEASAQAGQLLHAEKLTIRLPSGGRKTFTAPLPKDFQAVLADLPAK